MDNRNKLITFLGKNQDRALSLLDMSKATKIPYSSLHRLYNKNKQIFEENKIGKSVVIKLRKNEAVKNYLIVASYEETQEFLKTNKILNEVSNELPKGSYCLALFGSYAEGKQTKKSDIDLLIINKNGSKNINFSKYEILFKVEINPIFISFKEFRQMLKDKEENVGKQTLHKHIILHNQELFWNEVFKNGF